MTRRWRVSAALVLVLACAALVGLLEAAPAHGPRGFDHLDHDTKVAVSGAVDLPCEACHRLDGRSRPVQRWDHASCLAACHGGEIEKAAVVRSGREQAVCRVCHGQDELDRARTGKRPRPAALPAGDPEFGLQLSHAAHASLACESCHSSRARQLAPHDRCSTCHASTDTAPSITRCQGCHNAQVGWRGPHIERGPMPVTGLFDHDRHARSAKTRECQRCHAPITTAAGDALPAPTKASCDGCHDGQTAFSTTGPDCTRCHASPRAPVALRSRQASFSHDAHRGECRDCHRLTPSGSAVLEPLVHERCAQCHAAEFSATEPMLCGVCHVGREPWRKLHAEPRSKPQSDFSVNFDHAPHDRSPRGCVQCHVEPGVRAATHRRCGGETCHGDAAAPAPALADCRACHAAAKLEVAPPPWSVGAAFRHQSHRIDPRTEEPLSCGRCHQGADPGDSRPPKSACVDCHDGATAFKVTGHDCRRCHRPPSRL